MYEDIANEINESLGLNENQFQFFNKQNKIMLIILYFICLFIISFILLRVIQPKFVLMTCKDNKSVQLCYSKIIVYSLLFSVILTGIFMIILNLVYKY
jgi:uncharacterized membrane protein (DUF485 family)